MSNLGAIMASEIAETPKVFKAILDNKDVFDSIKNVLVEQEIQSVLILARGTSDNAAHYLKYLIETQIGLPVGLTSPSSVTVYESKLKYSKTLVVAISQSGQSPDLVKFATAAREANAYIIAITNDESSPLARVAHNHFSLLAGPELAVAATKSYNAQLLISYLLVATWTDTIVNAGQIISEATRIAESADLVAPDGTPLMWMLRKMGNFEQNRVAGMDVFQRLCELCSLVGISVFFLVTSFYQIDKKTVIPIQFKTTVVDIIRININA
jgi:glucosamine--fructose-6-phosphate aminotransferase (isomerizing)